MKTLTLIRHATSTGQAPDANLTTEGHAQAEQLATRLADLNIDALYSSPYARALATVTPYSRRTGLKITKLNDLRHPPRCRLTWQPDRQRPEPD